MQKFLIRDIQIIFILTFTIPSALALAQSGTPAANIIEEVSARYDKCMFVGSGNRQNRISPQKYCQDWALSGDAYLPNENLVSCGINYAIGNFITVSASECNAWKAAQTTLNEAASSVAKSEGPEQTMYNEPVQNCYSRNTNNWLDKFGNNESVMAYFGNQVAYTVQRICEKDSTYNLSLN